MGTEAPPQPTCSSAPSPLPARAQPRSPAPSPHATQTPSFCPAHRHLPWGAHCWVLQLQGTGGPGGLSSELSPGRTRQRSFQAPPDEDSPDLPSRLPAPPASRGCTPSHLSPVPETGSEGEGPRARASAHPSPRSRTPGCLPSQDCAPRDKLRLPGQPGFPGRVWGPAPSSGTRGECRLAPVLLQVTQQGLRAWGRGGRPPSPPTWAAGHKSQLVFSGCARSLLGSLSQSWKNTTKHSK